MRICLVAFDGFDELDVVGPYEVFAHAARLEPGVSVEVVTAEPASEVVGAHGLRIGTSGVLAGRADLVVVPGGGWVARAPRGVRAEIERGVLPRLVAAQHAAGAVVAGVCTGAMLLARAGLLDGRPATTHAGALRDLEATAAIVTPRRVVDAGTVVTCGGVTAGIDLALHLVERWWGRERAGGIAEVLEYPWKAGADRGGR